MSSAPLAITAAAASTADPNALNYMDSLPYVDKELALPGMRAAVDTLVDQEMAKLTKRDDRHTSLPTDFDETLFRSNPLWRAELTRVHQKRPTPAADALTARYALPEEAEFVKDAKQEKEDEPMWQEAVRKAKVASEYQKVHVANVELANKFGGNAWLIHNFQLEHALALVQAEREAVGRESVEVNKERKREQLQLATSLYSVSEEWNQLIGTNLQTEIACAALEAEVARLRAEHERLVDGTVA